MDYNEQLNEAAALCIMGWHKPHRGDKQRWFNGWLDDAGKPGTVYGASFDAWDPCDKWVHAFLLVRKMRKDGFHFCLVFSDGDPEASFFQPDGEPGHTDGYYKDPNECIAITTAAIIAKGGLGALPVGD